MSKHKTPNLNARNWEEIVENNDADLVSFEKLRHHQKPSEQKVQKSDASHKQDTQRFDF